MLTAAEALEIAGEVLRLIAGYPSVRLNREETARLSAAFVGSLSALPLWAVRQACKNWAAGHVQDSNPAFPPNAVQLKLEADRVASPRRLEKGAIDMVLKADVERVPTDDERDAAVAHWREAVRPTMDHADVSDQLDPERSRAEFEEASKRANQAERTAAGANPNVPRTLDMERSLDRIRDDQRAAEQEAADERDTADAER